MKSRGLTISDENKALHLLEHLSYYRLSGYWYPLLENPKVSHQFKKESTFSQAFKMYCFDRELRSLVLRELEKIEVAIRAKMIYTMSHEYDSFWYTYPGLFSNQKDFKLSLQKLQSEFSRSDADFIKNFGEKYLNPMPPSWMMMEVCSFGALSKLYDNLKPSRSKRNIAKHFGLNENIFSSWIHSLVYIRNVCAHHSRFWNRELQITPMKPDLFKASGKPHPYPAGKWIEYDGVFQNRAYYLLSILSYLLNVVNPSNSFKSKLIELFDKYPSINKGALNFPKNWESQELWS